MKIFALFLLIPSLAFGAAVKPGLTLITSGTYTPTGSVSAIVTSVTPTKAQWLRVGNTVTVSGQVTAGGVAGSGTTNRFFLTLPIPSTTTNGYDVAGTACATDVSTMSAAISGFSNKAMFQWVNDGVSGSRTFTYTYTYEVK